MRHLPLIFVIPEQKGETTRSTASQIVDEFEVKIVHESREYAPLRCWSTAWEDTIAKPGEMKDKVLVVSSKRCRACATRRLKGRRP
jgi:hypothetical protein